MSASLLHAPAPKLGRPPLAQMLQDAAEHRSRGEIDIAICAYETVRACYPDHAPALLALGALHVGAGRPGAAEPLLRQCCAHMPDNAEALHAWGLALLLLGRHLPAQAVLASGHLADPGNALCAVHLADAAHACGADAAQARVFEAARCRAPSSLGVLTGLATTLTHLGRRDAAIDVLEAAVLLHPDAVVPIAIRADMLARTTRQAEAEAALRRALALDPANHDAAMALSVVLMRLHRYAESLDVLRRLLDTPIDRVGPLCNMATVLIALGRQAEAVACAREAIALAPQHPAPRRALCNALPYHQQVSGAGLLQAASACAQRQPRDPPIPLHNDPARSRRLRIGLLSGTLRTHPVGWLTVAGFEQLDPAQFELICLTPNQPDDSFGRRFAAIAADWDDTGGMDDRQLAAHIRARGIDILVDLGGYGDFGRMQLCAYRAAPVQIKWVGMQNHSTGLQEMDWFVSDRWSTPPELAGLYSEKLLLLPDGYVCYAPPEDAPDVAALPALTHGHLTFGCYNNLAKITPAVIAAWARILHALPDAALILKTHQFNDRNVCQELRAAFASQGISPARIGLRGSSPHRELLRQYGDIDIVLDPFPYSGGLTTCEALWMGVPTLTMPGETFASRHSASHMSNIGLPDWVVPDLDTYVARAVGLAAQIPALSLTRAGLRDRVRQSPLCDAPRFGIGLSAALRRSWHHWCQSTVRD